VFDSGGIRPTGDRVRETLFNWLGPRLAGAACLDLFAGSGALGIEALSRGAARVVFVERQPAAARRIEENLQALDCGNGRVLCGDANTIDLRGPGPFDVVFLDPPFDNPGLADLCKLLETSGSIAADALIYLEVATKTGLPDLPPNWQVLREKTAGQVRFALAQRTEDGRQE
jgi:16S rRNA (guanine966-N2)-methyltransferase